VLVDVPFDIRNVLRLSNWHKGRNKSWAIFTGKL